MVILLTGLSGAGKTTIAGHLANRLHGLDARLATVLDGDVVREFLSKGLGFSREDRMENIRRIAFVASLITQHGGVVIISAIAPYAASRREARKMVEAVGGTFFEIHVATELAVCEARDPKGLYKKVRAGELQHFTGLDDPYEPPQEPELRIDAGRLGLEECVEAILNLLVSSGVLEPMSGPGGNS